MVYDTFLNTVKEQMEQALGDGYSLTLRKVHKNNGLILDGLCIAKGNGTIAPSIYLNSCYEQYLNGTSMEEIIQKELKNHDYGRRRGDRVTGSVALRLLSQYGEPVEVV